MKFWLNRVHRETSNSSKSLEASHAMQAKKKYEEGPTLLDDKSAVVSLAWGPDRYDCEPPFSPGIAWPEYGKVCKEPGGRTNEIYRTVRESFGILGLDADRYGTEHWNPLGKWIRPGDTVLLKPNFVRDFRESDTDDAGCLITHGSIIRAVLDYAYIALQGKGRLIVADAPQNDASFEGIRKIVRIDDIQEFYRSVVGFPIEVYDLRPETALKIDGVIVGHNALAGDPAGYVKVNLGRQSAFHEIEHLCHKLYGAEYNREELLKRHTNGVHEYLICKTVLDADCVISIPKLKSHKKTGLTANLKNLVGINGNKNWLPHHREGTPAEGGDQFCEDRLLRRTERAVVETFKKYFPKLGSYREILAGPVKRVGKAIFGDTNDGTVRSGNWFGNDTTWRMVIDLNIIMHYANSDGVVNERPIRRFFSVVDGIVSGEGNGPLDPDPKPTGVVLAGMNPVAVDLACARLMGFDYLKIPMLRHALERKSPVLALFGFDDVTLRSNDPTFNIPLVDLHGPIFGFIPHFGWKDHIEICRDTDENRSLA